MGKIVDMSDFDALTDNMEEYLNKQECSLGDEAERLQKLLFSIQYCYIHGVLTDSQCKQANQKFLKKFNAALHELTPEEIKKNSKKGK